MRAGPQTATPTATELSLSLGRPATPGAAAGGTHAIGLPRPLAPSQAARLRRIFDLQAAGAMEAAAREAELLEDRRLIGHVLADRFLRAPEAAAPAALRAWLAAHGDHPDAPAIHALLARRLPRGAALPPVPRPVEGALDADAEVVVPEERPPMAARAVRRNPALDRTVRELARAGEEQRALAQIARARGMTPAYAALLKADIALTLFQQGRDEAAFRLASEAARRRAAARAAAGEPGFVAGLAAWGMGRHELALPYFETAARAEDATAALRSAAAFWAARAAVRARKPQLYVPWMTRAAQEPRTFYGLVARRALGLAPGLAWESDLAGEAEGEALAETAGGWRALALLQIGQTARAEAELRQLWPLAEDNPPLARAMLLAAAQAGMTHLGAQLAALAQSADGRPRDFARFPLPRLDPPDGFRIDPALLYAIARQESNFNPRAVSPAGARGLMQIMPATASYVARDPSLRNGNGAQRLHDPGLSLELGQRYLLYLARHETVGDDLIRLLAAYNAGPGNLSRWLPSNGHRDDPFLFIESLPVPETRVYVRRVLAHSWIYASRLGLPAPSLDALAAGQFPRFAGPEEVEAMLRQSPRRVAAER
ncbi:lytic transglycosylase domain-containing protein [Caldovatus sediminis]|uniref:lytic transglycosylase domain-containing protein n=1 Tax=Caldovatus sediminis TaxID=2041189 RepID=UPI001E63EC76|nr:lytic transglycosylase domain-containing protein [Caldovatus sediminis]